MAAKTLQTVATQPHAAGEPIDWFTKAHSVCLDASCALEAASWTLGMNIQLSASPGSNALYVCAMFEQKVCVYVYMYLYIYM